MSEQHYLIDKRETAERLGISVRSLDRLIRANDNPLPHVVVGRLVKFRPIDVQVWIESKVSTDAPRMEDVDHGGTS